MACLNSEVRITAKNTAAKTNKKSLWVRIWKYRNMYLFLLPAVVWFFIFQYIPIYGLTLAFKEFSFKLGILGSPYIGLRYFNSFLTDPAFYEIVGNTLKITLLKLLFGFPAPIILALMLNEVKNLHFKKVVQTVSYLPYFVNWVVVVTLMVKFLSPTYGVINDILQANGMQPVYFMGSKTLFYPLVVGSDIWKNIGWGSIIYLAALTNIDPTLYEAATIDSAGRWACLVHITLPSLKPTIGILLILSLGGIFNAGYEQLLLMRNPSVLQYAEVLDTYVIRRGLTMGQFGYSTAIGFVQSIIALILIVISNKLCRKATEVSLW